MAEKEDYSANPLYNRELLRQMMGWQPFQEAPAAEEAPVTAPMPPRRPKELTPAPQAAAQPVSRDDEQAREAYEKMTKPSVPAPLLAGATGYGETLAPGVFPSLVAAGAKGLGKLGVSGYERFAEQPFAQTREEVVGLGRKAREEAPVAGALGTAAGLGAGMATLPVIAPEAGPAISGALTGGALGFASGAAEKNQWSDALKEGLMGVVAGGVGAPIAERAMSGLLRLAFGGKPVVDASGALTPEAVRIAAEAGLTAEQIAQLGPQLRQTFEQRGLTPEAAREAPFREFGIEPKRGMVTEDPEQLTHEIKHGEYETIAGQAKGAAEQFAEEATGRAPVGVREAIDAAVARGQANAAAMKAKYQAAYKVAEQAPGKFSKEAITNVGDRLMQNLAADVKAQHLYHEPFVQSAAEQLNKSLGQAIEGPGGAKILWQNFQAVEGARKGLNTALERAKTSTEKAGIRRLIEDYDRYVEGKLLDGSFSGAPNVVDDWRKARKLFSDYQNKYGVKKTGEDAGNLMRDILERNRSSDDVARMMFNFAGSGDVTAKANALKVFNQIRRAVGPNAPELQDIRSSFISQMMTPVLGAGEKATPAHFADTAKQIDGFLRGNAASFSRAVLNDAERAALARYADVMRTIARKPNELTPERLGAIQQAAWFSAPIVAEMATGILSRMVPEQLRPAILLGAGMYSRRKAMEGSQLAAEAAANLPPRNVPRVYREPSMRTLLPLGEMAREREGRATGGRAPGMTADMLISAVDRAKNKNNASTKDILKAPDEHVVKALEIAKGSI